MNIFFKYAKLAFLVSTIVFFVGCEDEVEELPQVKAGFTYTLNEDTGTVTFINTSTNATKYLWDFGDDETSKEIDPIKTYPTGTYIVSLTASHVSGASDIFKDTIAVNVKVVASLPITFDNSSVKYAPTAFSGASFAVVENPDQSGSNDKVTKVGAITNSGAAFEGIFFDLGNEIDLSANKRISMNIWSDKALSVLIKLEEGTAGALEVSRSHGGTGWEKLAFDFNSTAKYSRLTLFIDGPGTTAGTFYIDDIEQEGFELACTPETTQSLSAADFNLTFQTDPSSSIISDNAGFEWATNPNFDNALNSSCKVAKISRTAASLFANNQINLDAKLDFNSNSGFKVKVFSDVPGFKLLIKLEDKANSGINTELEVTSTKTNEWEELTFPFASSQSNKYDKIILFFDLNTNNEKVYYFDDLKLYGSGSGVVCVEETAQSLSAADFNLTFQTDPSASIISDNAGFEWAFNPSFENALNSSCKVGKISRTAASLFANNQINLDAKLNFNTSSGFKVKVFSDVPGFKLLIKLEDKANAGTNTELEVTSTKTNEWEELTFPFAASQSNKYDKIILFFDLNTNNQKIYYFDDLRLYGTGGGGSAGGCAGTPVAAASIPVDFEGCSTFLSSENFGSGITSELFANPSKTGINTSDYVLKVNKPTGSDFFAGIQNTFASNFNLTTANTFKIKVYSTKANVVFRFELAVNPQTNPVTGNPAPVFKTITNANEWTEVSITFTGLPGGPTAYNQLVIKPDNNQTDSPITAGGTYYLDDLTLTAGGGGGATAPTTAAPTPPARAAADVISIFSNAYTNITGVDYNPNWGQGTVTTTIDIAGNATLKYATLNYQGTDFSGNAQDVSGMNFLHLDYWTANSTALNVSLISPGPVEKAKALTVPTNGNWTSIDIPVADFSPVALANLIQLKFDGNGDIFLDNIYFYKAGAPATSPTTAAPTPPARAAADVISIFSNAYTNITGVDYNPNWGQGTVTTTIDVAGNATLKYATLNYQGTDFSGNAQDVSGMGFIHVDFWTANSTALNVSIISTGPVEKAKALTVPTNGNWSSIDIPLTDFSPPVNLANIVQLKFDGNGDIFLDNIYFYKTSGGSTPGANLATNGNFETGDATGWMLFQNGGTAALDNTTNNGGAWSGKLATGGPSNPAFKQERIGAGTVQSGDVVQIKFDHKGTVVQPGAVFNVLLFGEGASGASFTHVFNPAPIPGTNWTTFTGTFTIGASTDVSEGISFLIEAVCGGDAGCSVSANIDNVSVTLNP